jgi:hypothetical protein
VTKLILKTSKNVLKNKHKEAKYKTAIPMKFSSKFRLSTYVEKNINFSFCSSFFGGVTKFEALQKAFVTKLNPPNRHPTQENQGAQIWLTVRKKLLAGRFKELIDDSMGSEWVAA